LAAARRRGVRIAKLSNVIPIDHLGLVRRHAPCCRDMVKKRETAPPGKRSRSIMLSWLTQLSGFRLRLLALAFQSDDGQIAIARDGFRRRTDRIDRRRLEAFQIASLDQRDDLGEPLAEPLVRLGGKVWRVGQDALGRIVDDLLARARRFRLRLGLRLRLRLRLRCGLGLFILYNGNPYPPLSVGKRWLRFRGYRSLVAVLSLLRWTLRYLDWSSKQLERPGNLPGHFRP
jgi:hypothetical protein